MARNLKTRTAHTLKWNLVDRVATQVLYAVTGIVLARILSQEDFGLVGAVLVFQAFASLIVDSGFSYALIQRKRPTRLDYSTVLWFNLFVAALLYAILYVGAPLIAKCFQNDVRIIPLSRVLFLSIILNASAIVQTNRLMKAMSVRMVAISNSIGLSIGAVVGIILAVSGFGAWAIVWQTLSTSAVKSLVLWTTSRWRPLSKFSLSALKSYFGIGSKMMLTSFLNTVFQNIYSFFIGNRAGLVPLGYYTQSDKWSKMGITSLSQVLTSSFLPALSAVQDEKERFASIVSKMNRFTAYLLYPSIAGLILMATPIFHTLFDTKWDPSIILFQLLLFRGIFTVLNSLYNNYLLALGHSRYILWLEVLRDSVAIVALVLSLPYINYATPDNPVYGLTIIMWGQVASTIITWVATLYVTLKATKLSAGRFIADNIPYIAQTGVIIPIMATATMFIENQALLLFAEAAIGVALYVGGNFLLGSKIQKEVFQFLLKRNEN
ncbi:MAG: lipopolysaccharide biosynthesis protein [Muribaculaceae bacterium]|nr:lipopolysaccharide biosynthesis protein [Muribaculaceae bacterium]